MLIKRDTSWKVASSPTLRDCFSNPLIVRRRLDPSQMAPHSNSFAMNLI
jgi:hypothetical protein